MGESTRDGLGSIHLGVGAHGNEFSAIGILVGGDIATKEIDLRRGPSIGVNQLDVFQSTAIGHETTFGGCGIGSYTLSESAFLHPF